MFFRKSDVLSKADKYLRQKKYKLALEEFLKYLQKNPNDVNIINRVGDLYAQIGDKDKAIDFFMQSANYYYNEGFFTKAIAILRKVLRIDPNNIKVLEKLADIYVQDGNIPEAKRVYLEIAEKYTKQGLRKRALDIYKKMVDLDPLNVSVRLKLADAFIKEGMKDEAADQLISTAKKLIKQGKTDEAKQMLSAAQKLGLGDAVVDVTLAQIYIEKKEYDKAEQLLDKAYSSNTSNTLLLELIAFVKLKVNKPGEAISIARKLFDLDKTKFSVLETIYGELVAKNKINEAWSLIKPVIDFLVLNEKFDKAIELLKKITGKKEYFIPALKKLAEIYEKKGDRIFNVTTLEKLAEAYKKDGNIEEAKATLRKLLEYDPANIEYKEMLKELKAYEISDEEISVSEEDFELDEEELVESLDLEDTTQKLLGGISEAEFYIEHGYKDKAYSMLEQILKKEPLNKKANLLLIPLCKEKGERAKASQCYLNLAELAIKEGEYEKAEDYLNQSERLLPGSSAYLRRLLNEKMKEQGMVEVESFDFEPEEDEISVIDLEDSLSEEELDMDLFGEEEAQEQAEELEEEVLTLQDEAVSSPEEFHEEAISIDDEESELSLEDDFSSDILFEEKEREEKERESFIGEDTLLDADAMLDSLIKEDAEQEVSEESSESKIESVDLFESIDDVAVEFAEEKAEEQKQAEQKEEEKDGEVQEVDLTDEIAEIEFYISQNLFEEAEEMINTLKSKYPNHKDVKSLVAKFEDLRQQSLDEQLVAEKSGDFEELLEEEFIDLKSQFGEDLEIFQDNTELTDTAPQEEVKSLDELFREFKKGVEEQIDKEDYETHYNLGIAYKEMGLYNEAIEEFVKASHDPSRVIDCSFMIAGVYAELGEFNKAIEWLESGLQQAKKQGKDEKPILYELASLCEKMGQNDKAKSYYAMIYEKDPNYRDVSSKLN